MSDTVHDLDALAPLLARMEAEIARLKRERTSAPTEGPLSRRALLRLAGAGVVGAGAAVASGIVHAKPAAAATTGPYVGLGNGLDGVNNNAGINVTSVSAIPDNAASVFAAYNTGTAQGGIYGQGFSGSGISVFAGVLGDTNQSALAGTAGINNNGIGVRGVNGGLTNLLGSGIGQSGYSTAGVVGESNGSAGVLGLSTVHNEAGVFGFGSRGVEGRSDGTADGVGVQGIGFGGTGVKGYGGSTGTGVAGDGFYAGTGVYGVVSGTPSVSGTQIANGSAIVAEILDGGGGPPTAASVAVAATNEGLGPAVKAVSTSGLGVSAQGGQAPLRLVPSASVVGPPTAGNHVQGELFVDKNGVLWLCTLAGPPGTWARAITSGLDSLNTTGAALQVNQAGTGSALIGNVANAASAAIGVYGQSNGSGQAVKGYNNGTGMAVYGQVNNTANASPAVQGYTNGKGPGVEGNQVGTGYGVLGNIANTSNSSAAVRGVTNGTGPALQGAGGRAQLNLVPGGSFPPSSPQSGDFFVDSSGGLHYRKGNTWVTLA